MNCLLQIHLRKDLYSILSNVLEPSELNLKSIALMDNLELQYRANLTKEETNDLKVMIAKIVFQDRVHKGSELKFAGRIRIGCDTLDEYFGNGLPTFGITELVGESSVGKTQICLQLALFSVLSEIREQDLRSAVYICTEDIFPIKRLNQIYEQRRMHFERTVGKTDLRDYIFIQHIADYNQLLHLMNTKLKTLLLYRRIGLIVIDSIAGLFRSYNDISYIVRAQVLTNIVRNLTEIARLHNAVVICTNQVTSNTTTGRIQPCLGLAWSNLISRRFVISRRYPSKCRTISASIIDYHIKRTEAYFTINEFGVSGTQHCD